jgi:hypothetical protein
VGHVHFAESHNHQYRNPLRAGGLAPYRDTTAPTVAAAGSLRQARIANRDGR